MRKLIVAVLVILLPLFHLISIMKRMPKNTGDTDDKTFRLRESRVKTRMRTTRKRSSDSIGDTTKKSNSLGAMRKSNTASRNSNIVIGQPSSCNDSFFELQSFENATTSSRICRWVDSLQDCKTMISQALSRKNCRDQHYWHFWGDSSMRRMFQSIEAQGNKGGLREMGTGYVQASKHSDGCTRLKYLNAILNATIIADTTTLGPLLRPATEWIPPNGLLGEGPKALGIDHPYCTDCQGCDTKRSPGKQLSGNKGIHPNWYEYMAMEFARDVEMPSQKILTTQGTLAAYVRHLRQYDGGGTHACVIGVGLHDMAVKPMPTPELYEKNVHDFIQDLDACSIKVWIGLNAVMENNPKHPQRNDMLKAWNEAVYEMLLEKFSDVYIVDIWSSTINATHIDNVHLTPEFYAQLGSLFVLS